MRVNTPLAERGGEITIGRGQWADTAKHSINSVVRGLEELITNSATSYFKLGKPSKILIEYERHLKSCRVTVRDEAAGLSKRELIENVIPIAPDDVKRGQDIGRGYFRRGLKDLITRGDVNIASVKNGRICRVRLYMDGTIPRYFPKDIVELPISEKLLVAAGFAKYVTSGTNVTWEPQATGPFKIPLLPTLREGLRSQSALWRLIADWDQVGHELRLRDKGGKAERLTLSLPPGRPVYDQEIRTSVSEAQPSRLRVYWSSEPLSDHSGIVVCGADGVYDFPFGRRSPATTGTASTSSQFWTVRRLTSCATGMGPIWWILNAEEALPILIIRSWPISWVKRARSSAR